jgi:hypothetical protein
MSNLAESLLAALHDSPAVIALFDAQDALQWSNASEVAQALPRERGAAARRHAMPDGRAFWVLQKNLPDGGLLVVASDITALDTSAVAAAGPEPESVTSPRDLLEQGSAALDETLARRQSFSLALVEVDETSDAQLGQFMRRCRPHLRPGDTLGRLSGGQFLLLLSGAGSLAASAIVERLRRRLAEDPLASMPEAQGLRAGLATARAGDSLDALMQRARRALSVARQGAPGAARVVLDAGSSA